MKVHNRYAISLYECSENNDKTLEELNQIAKIFKENLDFFNILMCKTITFNDKQKLINNVFDGRCNEYTLNFIKVLCKNERISDFVLILKEYQKLIYLNNNKIKVKFTTAIDIDEDLRLNLIKKAEEITKKDVLPIFIIDPKILGGVIISYENTVIDGSLKNKLQNLNKEIRK